MATNQTTVTVTKNDGARIRRAQMIAGYRSAKDYMHKLLHGDSDAQAAWELAGEDNYTRRLLEQLKVNGWVIVPTPWVSRVASMAHAEKVKVSRKTIEKGVVEFTLS